MSAWKLNKTITREPSYFLLSARCWDGDTLYSAKSTRLLTKLVLMALTYTEKKNYTARSAERHPPLRCCILSPDLTGHVYKNVALFKAVTVEGSYRLREPALAAGSCCVQTKEPCLLGLRADALLQFPRVVSCVLLRGISAVVDDSGEVAPSDSWPYPLLQNQLHF